MGCIETAQAAISYEIAGGEQHGDANRGERVSPRGFGRGVRRARHQRFDPRRKVAAVGVIGAGTMGSGIAMVFANAELPVTLIEKDADGLARGLSRIDDVYQRVRTKGTLPEPELTARRARITGCTDFAKLRDADLIVEAVLEDMAVKSDVFVQLDEIASPAPSSPATPRRSISMRSRQ